MRVDEAERTRGVRDKKEKKRADKEAARLQAQYVFFAPACHTLCCFVCFVLNRKSKVVEFKNGGTCRPSATDAVIYAFWHLIKLNAKFCILYAHQTCPNGFASYG